MTTTIRRIMTAGLMAALIITLARAAAAQMPQTSTSTTAGAPTVATEQLKGTVVQVDGSDLLVRMNSGDLRNFPNVPADRKFMVDGKELSLRQLQPGTSLTATITTTTTPITTRTTTVGSGKVWYVSGNTVILTLPNGENKQYKVQDSYRFNVNGQPASVHDLRKGMTVAAEKIVEEPSVQIASGVVVTGTAPAAATVASATPSSPAQPRQMAAATAPAPVTAPEPAAAEPAALPKTGSPVPLFGVLGLFLVGLSLGLRKLQQS